MARQLLPDEVWEIIEPLLLERPNSSKVGRPPIQDRDALTGILFVLKTGIPWEHLPGEMGCGCGMTCLRRLREWQQSGVWSKIQLILANNLRNSDQFNWSRIENRSSSKSSRSYPKEKNRRQHQLV